MNTIGFPGFGIGPFTIDPVAFRIFGFDILWYGIIVVTGILCAIFYSFRRAKKNEGISPDDMIDIAIFGVPAAIIGARIYFILFNLENYQTVRSWFAIRSGGLAVYGGIIAGVAVCFAVCKFKKLCALKALDATAPAIMLGQIIGRWGNFINAEAYGTATELPWRMSILGSGEVHPTFLYESLWNLLGFALINLIIYKRKKFDGQIFLIYIAWYGFGRMLIEGLRVDSLWLGGFRVSQIFGGLCFIAGVVLLIWLAGKAKIRELENDPEYKSVYGAALARIADESADEAGGEPADEPGDVQENESKDVQESDPGSE